MAICCQFLRLHKLCMNQMKNGVKTYGALISRLRISQFILEIKDYDKTRWHSILVTDWSNMANKTSLIRMMKKIHGKASSCYTFKHNKLLNCTYTLTLLVGTIEIMQEVCIYRVKHTPTFSRSKCHFFWLFHPLTFFTACLFTIMHIFDDNF